MQVKFLVQVFAFWLTLIPATAVGTDGQAPTNTQQSKENSQNASFGELLEFLGQWETDDGRHVLVEAAGGTRFELQLTRTDLLWRLLRTWPEELLA